MTDTFLILLIDRKHGHFYRFGRGSGGLEQLEERTDDVPRPTKGASWAGLADDKVARHIEGHVAGHYRDQAARLERYLKQSEFRAAGVIVGGPEVEVAAFQEALATPTRERVVAVIHPEHHAGLKALEGKILEALRRADERQIVELLAQIENSRQPDGRGVVGVEPVLEALNLKQVQTLLISRGTQFAGWRCPADGSLSTSLSQCPICLGPMEETADLRAAITKLAAAQRAEILEVDGTFVLPDEYQGLAALKRFA